MGFSLGEESSSSRWIHECRAERCEDRRPDCYQIIRPWAHPTQDSRNKDHQPQVPHFAEGSFQGISNLNISASNHNFYTIFGQTTSAIEHIHWTDENNYR